MDTFCSTIIPTIGRPSIARAVQSVLDQTMAAEFEVVVANDSGQPLPTGAWQSSPRVRLITTQRHAQCVACNTGAAIARGRYLNFLGDDDWLLPGALAAFWELAQRAPQADWLYGGVRLVDGTGKVLRESNPGIDGNVYAQLMAGMWITTQSSLIGAEAFFAAGGFHPLLKIGEETDLGRSLTRNGDVAHTPAVVACILRGQGWHTSITSYAESPEANRWSRDRALGAAGAFGRLRASAGSAYWRGRILQAYLAAAHWNWRRGRYTAAASRLAYALLSLALAGSALGTRPYWQALRDEQVPFSAGSITKGI